MESATENNRLYVFNVRVRVKMCGKSAQVYVAIHVQGKPYREQGKIGMYSRLFWLNMRVCRLDTWLPTVKVFNFYTDRIRLIVLLQDP